MFLATPAGTRRVAPDLLFTFGRSRCGVSYPHVHCRIGRPGILKGDRSFFENETRAFLAMPEIRERLPAQEPFLRRADLGAFCGRKAELDKVREFLNSPHLFLVMHGMGEIGKTRLLVEAGEEIASEGVWQVLWANVASMAGTGAWFDAVVPERPTLLFVDEPPDAVVLQQLGGRVGRLAQWKVAAAVRSPKDPVLRFLFGPRMKLTVQELAINSLKDEDAEAMCTDLLSTGTGKLAALPTEQRADAARDSHDGEGPRQRLPGRDRAKSERSTARTGAQPALQAHSVR